MDVWRYEYFQKHNFGTLVVARVGQFAVFYTWARAVHQTKTLLPTSENCQFAKFCI